MVTLILIPLGIEVVLTSTPLAFESEMVVFSQMGVLNVTGITSVAACDESNNINRFIINVSMLIIFIYLRFCRSRRLQDGIINVIMYIIYYSFIR